MSERLSDEEIKHVDATMSEHMYRHSISNSINGMGCDAWCRAQALGRALQPILAARLAEAEQAAEQRERERWVTEVEALADEVGDSIHARSFSLHPRLEDYSLTKCVSVDDLRALAAQQRDGGGNDD